MTIAVLIHEEAGKLEEINLDIDPVKNEIYKILSGRATFIGQWPDICLLYTSPSPRDQRGSRMPSSA